MRLPSGSLLGFAAVALAASGFGMLGPLSRFAYAAGMEPIALVAWRGLVAAIAVGLFVAWRVRWRAVPLIRPASLDRTAVAALAVGALMAVTLNIGMFIAFDLIAVALALLGFYTFPAMVAVVSIATGRERLDRPRAAALGLALAGMVAVVAAQLDPAAGIRFDALGFGLALGAAVSQTVFILTSRGYRTVPVDQAMLVVFVGTVVATGGLVLVTGAGASLVTPLVQPGVLPLVLVNGLFAAAIPTLLFVIGLRRIGGMRAGIVMLLEPVVGAVLAAWLLAEGLSAVQVAGGVAILAAAFILQRAAAPAIRAPVTAATPAGARLSQEP